MTPRNKRPPHRRSFGDVDNVDTDAWLRKAARIPRSLRQRISPTPKTQRTKTIPECRSHGVDNGCGNMLAIQAWITPEDLLHIGTYAACWEDYFQAAQAQGWLNEKSIVVLPEHVGTWLVMGREHQLVYESKEFSTAMQWMAFGRPVDTVTSMLQVEQPTPIEDQVFRTKAQRMADQYHMLFSRLAGKYKVTLVAGSIALPSPWLQDGKLRAGNGPLINVSLTFRPNGEAHPQFATKSHPSRIERQILTPTPPPAQVPVLATPAGKLCVRLGTDAWFRCPTMPRDALLAAPAYALPHAPNPLLFPTPDIYAGILVASRGTLWDTRPGGPTLFFDAHQPMTPRRWREAERSTGGSLVNVWLSSPPSP